MHTAHSGVIETVKDKSVATIKGAGNIVETTVDAAIHVVGTTVKDTAKVGGDIGAAATGLVAGAIEGTKELAVGAEHAVTAVAGGAIKAVGEVGSTAAHTVHKAVTKSADSDKAVLKESEMAVSKN